MTTAGRKVDGSMRTLKVDLRLRSESEREAEVHGW